MSIFELAEMQLIKEGQKVSGGLLISRAVTIRKWFDKHKGIADKILAGQKFYKYGNRFVIANR